MRAQVSTKLRELRVDPDAFLPAGLRPLLFRVGLLLQLFCVRALRETAGLCNAICSIVIAVMLARAVVCCAGLLPSPGHPEHMDRPLPTHCAPVCPLP
jgi:hypothetical protein